MSGPRFKLDLVTYGDPVALLPLPVAVPPTQAGVLPPGSTALDAQLARDPQVIRQLQDALTSTDMSYVHPISTDVTTTQHPSSILAQQLFACNPNLLMYAIAADPESSALVATPGRSGAAVIRTHSGQPDASVRKEAAPASAHTDKKRTRKAPKQEVYVMTRDEAQVAAAKLSSYLKSVLLGAAQTAEAAGPDRDADSSWEDGDQDDDVAAPGRADQLQGRRAGGRGRPAHRFRPEALRGLHQELLTAQSQGYLRVVSTAQLKQLLLALHEAAESGASAVLAEDDELKSMPVVRVACCLEAVLCELVVLATTGLPTELYLEQLLTRAVDAARHHLQVNVLAVHDVRFKRMYRAALVDEDEEPTAKVTKPRGRPRAAASHHLPRWCAALVGQLEQLLALLAEVVGLVRVGVAGLIPLVRMSQQSLTVESLSMLHYRALGLAVSMFKYYPQHRGTVMDEFVQSVLTHLSPGKHFPRHFPLPSADIPTSIQMTSAMVMQLVQVVAELPAVDAGSQAAEVCVNTSIGWSDYFWTEIFKKLPLARAAKAEAATDLRAWVEALVDDLLAAVSLPEWPAASVLLRRLVLAIQGERGLKSADATARLVCVDLLGQLSQRLCAMAKEADAPEATRAVAALLDAAKATATDAKAAEAVDRSELLQQLLLEHLAEHHPAAGASAAAASSSFRSATAGTGLAGAVADATSVSVSARQMIACLMLSAHVKAAKAGLPKGRELGAKEASEAILRYRQICERQRSCLGASTSGLPGVPRESATLLGRALMADSVLGRARPTLLRWLADAGGGGKARQEVQAAAVRAKAIKLLGGAIEADVRVLQMQEVQEGIRGALGDDSVLVREAAVDLIGKHISRSAELAAQYYEILTRASEDPGLTVRKRAIRLLWECCVRCPDFVHRSDALLRIVSRATDSEDTMRALVTKICSEIWFLPKFTIEEEDEVSHVARRPEQRAAQLGEVVVAVYAKSAFVSLPFHPGVPVVATVRGILGEDGRADNEAVRAGAREVADALLSRALELQGAADDPPQQAEEGGGKAAAALLPSDELFRCLLALHVLCLADVKLLHKAADPQRAVRCLAPYIKELPGRADDASARRKAEQLVVVLAILGSCLAPLRHLEEALAAELAADLVAIITRVHHVQAVSVAGQCLCTLARILPAHKERVREQAAQYFLLLEGDYLKKAANDPKLTVERLRMYPRFLYILGMLCRYGADVLDEATEGSKHPSCGGALALLLKYFTMYSDNVRIQETVLQAMGFIFIARPALAVDVREVQPILAGALDARAPVALKCRCLGSLTELLRVEEDAMLARQAAARREAVAAHTASTMPEAETRALARRNGEGDTGSVTSGLIQMLWDRIRGLATDVSPSAGPAASGQATPSTPSGATASAAGSVVRRRALELMEVVIRGGIVVPWEAVSALCALATDPERDTAGRALACLRGVVAANTAFVAGQVPQGVAEAYSFHCRLAALERPGQPPALDQSRPLMDGLGLVWSHVFQPDRQLKSKFLNALLKPLDDGCCLASGTAARSDPHLLSFLSYLVAELPYKRMDELLAVLVRLNEILSRRAEGVLGRFQELRQLAEARQDGDAGGPSTSTAGSNPTGTPPPSGSAAGGGGGGRLTLGGAQGLLAAVKAALAVCLMLLLKQYLRMAYDVATERVAKYDPAGPQRKVEEKLNAVHSGKHRFNASKLRLDVALQLAAAAANRHGTLGASGSAVKAASSVPRSATKAGQQGQGQGQGQSGTEGSAWGSAAPALSAAEAAAAEAAAVSAVRPGLEELYKVLKTLMKQDEADYRQRMAEVEAAALGEGGPDDVSPGSAGGGAGDMDVAAMMAAPAGEGGAKPLSGARGRGRGRGSRGGRTGRIAASAGGGEAASGGRGRGRGRGRGQSASGGRSGRKRKSSARDGSDEESDEDGDGSGEDAADTYRPQPRRRLEAAL